MGVSDERRLWQKMKYKKSYVLYMFAITVIFIGAINPVFTFLSVLIAAAIGVGQGLLSIKNPSCNHCKGIMLLLVLQNFTLGLGAHITGNMDSSLSLITQIPFIVIASEWLVLIVCQKNLCAEDKKHRLLFCLLLLLIIVSMLFGRGPFQSILVNIRNLTVFFMAYEIALLNLKSEKDFYSFEKFCFNLGVVVLVAGIVLLIGGFRLYEIIGIREVYSAKGSPIIGDALDDRFTTSLISRDYNRMGSLFYEPVNLGYFFSALTISAFFSEWTISKKKKTLYFCAMLLGLILSLGKGGYMITIATFGYVALIRMFGGLKKIVGRKFIRNGLIGFVIIAVAGFAIYYYKNIGAAVSPHFWGIIQTWGSVLRRPYGYGIGTGGNAALIYGSDINWYASGGETQLMSFVYQIGLTGGIIFILCVLQTKLSSKLKTKKGDEVFIIMPFVLLGMSLLQDNTFTPQCIVLFMFLLGGIKNIYYLKKEGESS